MSEFRHAPAAEMGDNIAFVVFDLDTGTVKKITPQQLLEWCQTNLDFGKDGKDESGKEEGELLG